MRRILETILIVFSVLLILFLIMNPQIIKDIWLWIVGFIGGIIGLIRNLFDLSKKEESKPLPNQSSEYVNKENIDKVLEEVEVLEPILETTIFEGFTLTVQRYLDDGQTTLGKLFLGDEFFCYTLEDTYRAEKIKGETRIPEGTYFVDYRKYETDLTLKYRKKYPEWFTYHLEIKNIENFQGVYIHVGNYHYNTNGCLLVAMGVNEKSKTKMITQSKVAFTNLYKVISERLNSGDKVRIILKDETV